MNRLIDLLQEQYPVWQGSAQIPEHCICSSGYPELDQALAGGFSVKGVTEIQSDVGIGELRLLMPTLCLANEEQRLIVFIAPKGVISAQHLISKGLSPDQVLVIYPDDQQQALWSAEQCLASGACHSVVMWLMEGLEIHQIKRLQVASDKGNCRQFILRSEKKESLSLPFDLSLSLKAYGQGVAAKINKRKYGWPSEQFNINMSKLWPELIVQARPDNVLPFPQAQMG